MIYRCDDCGEVFNYPSAVKNGFSHPFGDEIFTEDGCPFCGSLELTSVVYCDCGIHLKPKSAHLCKPCRIKLLGKVRSFFGTLTIEEEAQFDDWMDGNSITDRDFWTADE